MFRRVNILTFFAVFAMLVGLTLAQDTPKKEKEREVTVIVNGETLAETEPMERIRRDVQIITSDGGYLGVQLKEVTKENFSKFGLSGVRGVAVEKVVENSPAKQAGIQDGDVIIRFNGEEVSSIRKLMRLIGEVAPDHQTKITVLRSGGEREFTVTMGKREMAEFELSGVPDGVFGPAVPQVRMMPIPRMPRGQVFEVPAVPPVGGLRVSPQVDLDGFDGFTWTVASGKRIGINSISLTKQLADYFGIADGKGILISNVRENSPAAKAGLKAGDVIIEADGKSISDQMNLVKALNEDGKKTVNLTIVRNKNRQTVTVEPEGDSGKKQNLKVLEKVPTSVN